MVTESDLRAMLERFIGKNQPTILEKVKSVDEKECTCTLVFDDETTELMNVRLRPITGSNDGVLLIPKVGAMAIAVQIEDSEDFMIVSASEYEKAILLIADAKIEVSKDTVLFNGGQNHGLVKVEKLTQKLNAIEKDINTLKNVLSGWTPTPQDGGASLKATAASWFAAKITETKKEDIENEKVKH